MNTTAKVIAFPKQRIIPLAQVERAHILRAMKLLGNDVGKVATALGLSTRHLYRKLDQYGYADHKSWTRHSAQDNLFLAVELAGKNGGILPVDSSLRVSNVYYRIKILRTRHRQLFMSRFERADGRYRWQLRKPSKN